MTKRFLLLFVILTLGLFFLFTGLLGDRGYLANRSLKKKIYQMQYEIARLDSEIESLSKKSSDLSSEEGIRESALKLGFNVSGDEVFLFDNSSSQEGTKEKERNIIDFSDYIGLSNTKIMALASCVSAVITLLLALSFCRKKGKDVEIEEQNDSEQIQSRNNSDYLFFN